MPLPVGMITAMPAYGAMLELLRTLVNTGLNDQEIAAILTAEGFRLPMRDRGVLCSMVATLRRLGLLAPQPTAPWRLAPGRLSVKAVAAKLDVKLTWVYSRLRHGLIQLPQGDTPSRHRPSDRRLVPTRR